MRTKFGAALRAPDTPGPPRASRAHSLLPIVAGVLIAVIATTVYRQVFDPFLAHDDWESFLPKGIPHGADVFRRNLYVGRWLNYLWWLTLGRHGHPVLASALFQLPYLVFIVALARRVARGWLLALVIPALFVSPMVISLASWPATLGPSMLVLAASALALPLVRGRTWRLMLWLSAAAVLGVLTYPPVAFVTFLVMVIDQWHRRATELAALTACFLLSYAGALFVAFAVNWLEFGHFGVEIASWREPNPLHDVSGFVANLSRYGGQWQTAWSNMWLPLLIGFVAVSGGLVARSTRRKMGTLVLGGVVVTGLEAAMTVLSGVTTPFRASLWVWLLVVVPFVWCAQLAPQASSVATRAARDAGLIGLLVVSVWGSLYWSRNVSKHQVVQHQYDVIGDRIAVLRSGSPTRQVILAKPLVPQPQVSFFVQTRSLEMSLYVRDSIRVSRCDPALCDRILRQAIPEHRRQSTFLYDQRIIVVPPAFTD